MVGKVAHYLTALENSGTEAVVRGRENLRYINRKADGCIYYATIGFSSYLIFGSPPKMSLVYTLSITSLRQGRVFRLKSNRYDLHLR